MIRPRGCTVTAAHRFPFRAANATSAALTAALRVQPSRLQIFASAAASASRSVIEKLPPPDFAAS